MNRALHAQLAHKEARRVHGPSYSKAQFVEVSKSVMGGFASNPNKPIRTLEDVDHKRNQMALIDENYPLGMDGCTVVGLSGGCGLECPVYLAGECEEPPE